MLITDGNFNLEEFKSLVSVLEWKSAPRWIHKREEMFFFAFFEDADKKIEISVRPSLRMQVVETFKNRTVKGEVPPENYSGSLVDWGSSIEILVNQKFIDEIEQLSIPANQSSDIKKLEW